MEEPVHTSVRFRLVYVVAELWIPEGITHRFSYGGAHGVEVLISGPSAEDLARGHDRRNAACVSSSAVAVNENAARVFVSIESNAFASSERVTGDTRYKTPEGAEIRVPPLRDFPLHFQSFVETVGDELDDYATRTIGVLRWRTNAPGPHNPISTRGLHWSRDGSSWHPMPSDIEAHISAHVSQKVSDRVVEETRNLVTAGLASPLHRDLFREASYQRHSNPRSAVVIGMAAAETGIKWLIGTLVPNAEWLAVNVPSPPLVKILKEYLPALPARCNFEGTVKAPPPSVLETLKKGIDIRNRLAHAGAAPPSTATVDEILDAVHDLLSLLEFYAGTRWALELMRPAIRAELEGV